MDRAALQRYRDKRDRLLLEQLRHAALPDDVNRERRRALFLDTMRKVTFVLATINGFIAIWSVTYSLALNDLWGRAAADAATAAAYLFVYRWAVALRAGAYVRVWSMLNSRPISGQYPISLNGQY